MSSLWCIFSDPISQYASDQGPEDERIQGDQYVKKEPIIHDGISFIKTPSMSWNRANAKLRKDIQLLLFPNGIVYALKLVLEP